MQTKKIILDRDGTMNQDPGFLNDPELFEQLIFPGTEDSIKLLKDAGFEVWVVTNQSGIARGKVSQKNLEIMNEILKEMGVDKVLVCPHLPEHCCDCRKPNTGLIQPHLNNINKENSFVIGDKTSDVKFGRNLGITTILVKTGESGSDNEYQDIPDFITKDFNEAARMILDDNNQL